LALPAASPFALPLLLTRQKNAVMLALGERSHH
jgi:hypothetical protein